MLEATYVYSIGQTEFHLGLYSEPWESKDSVVIYYHIYQHYLLL